MSQSSGKQMNTVNRQYCYHCGSSAWVTRRMLTATGEIVYACSKPACRQGTQAAAQARKGA